MTVLTDFNKLFDDMAAALRLKKPAQEAREKVVAAIDEARKTDPELAERLILRSEYRERLRLKCPPELRELIQAKIEKQNCKCAGCGGPLDVDQQMIFDPPNMVCEFCCEEMIADTMKYHEEDELWALCNDDRGPIDVDQQYEEELGAVGLVQR